MIFGDPENPFLIMKRKEYGSSLYYIFQIFEDRVPKEDKQKFRRMVGSVKKMAGRMGMPLYDHVEISEALEAILPRMVKEPEAIILQRKVDETDENQFYKDININIFDHGTGKIRTLELGISMAPKENPE